MNHAEISPVAGPPNPMRRTHSLRARFLILLGGVSLLSLVVVWGGVYSFVYRTERQAWEGRQNEAARNAAETVAAFVQELQHTLVLVSSLDGDYLAGHPEVMQDLLEHNPALLEMVCVEATGRVSSGAYRDAPVLANLFTIPQSTWFHRASEGELYLGDVQVSPVGDPYLVMAVPSSDEGVTAARVAMKVLSEVVAVMHFGKTGQAYIVNRQGRILAHTDPEVALARTSLAGRTELVAPSRSDSQQWRGAYVNFQGIPVVGTVAPVPGFDWLVITELAQSEAFAASRMAVLLLGGGMPVLAVLTAWVTVPRLARLIFDPIKKLRDGAERIGQGDLHYQVDIDSQDEVGQVARAFNEMVCRLRQREEQLAARTDALAAEVVTRGLAEEAARQERDRAQQYLDTAQVMLVALNERGEITLINQEGARILGYRAEELLGKDWFDTCLPARVRDEVKVVLEGLTAGSRETGRFHENAVLTRDGEERIIAWRNTLLTDDRGRIVGTLSSGEDITERKRAEEALRESEKRFRQVADSAGDLIWEVDENGLFRYASPVVERILGYTADELVGKMVFCDLFAPDVREELKAATLGAFARREPFRAFSSVNLRKDGKAVVLETSGAPVLDQAGNLIGYRGAATDITERKRAEEALARERILLRTVIDNLPNAVYAKDAEGRKLLSNSADFQHMGLQTEAEVLGKTDWEMYPPEVAASFHADDRAVLQTGTPVLDREESSVDASGQRVWSLTSKIPLRDESGQITGIVGIGHDITERKLAEESLRESEEKYRNVVERASDGIAIIQDSVVQYANPRLADIWGGRSEEVIGTRFTDYIAPEELATVAERYSRRMAGESAPTIYETVLRNRYGERVYAELNAGSITYQGRPADLVIIRDITERKRAEESLARERMLLRTLIDNLPDAVYVKDAETRKVLANPADVRNMGLQAEAEVLGKTDRELFPPEVADRFYADDQAVLQTGTPMLDREELLVNTNGQQRWLSTSKLPLRDESGQITGLVGIGHDITERRQMLESAQRYARRLEALHEIDAAILSAQSADEIAQAALQRVRQLVPCMGTSIVTFDLEAGEGAVLAAQADAQLPVRRGMRFPLHRGAELQALQQGQVLMLDDMTALVQPPPAVQSVVAWSYVVAPLMVHGQLTGILVLVAEAAGAFSAEDVEIAREVASQITVAMQNARLQVALQVESQRLRTLVDNMPEGILLLDEANRVLLANPVGQEMLAWLAGDRPDGVLTHLGPHSMEAILGTGLGKPLVMAVQQPVERVLELLAHAISPEEQRRQGTIVILRDVTELRRVEEQARQQDRLVAIGQLAGGVAHDFNNLLTAIRGYTHLVHEALRSDDPLDWPPASEIRADLEQISKADERAAALTRQLLAFSRRQPLQPQVLDLNELIVNVQKMLGRLIGEHVILTTDLQPELWPMEADPGQIEQVIMNLAVNARDAMPQGGRLTIGTGCVTLGNDYVATHPDARPGDYVRLTVSDTGMGMSKHVLQHLFEPFFTTKEKGKGTGLGLATVYGIVKQSGGQIDVQTLPGAGTTFEIHLPRTTRVATVKQPGMAGGVTGGRETILLVEDEDAVRELAYRVLTRLGYTVLAAGLPTEALLLSERHPGHIDLLLTDVVMPEMDGHEVAARLTQSRPRTKVLYMSGYTDDVIESQGVSHPGGELMLKPFAPDALALKVRQVLDRREKPVEEVLTVMADHPPSATESAPVPVPVPARFRRTAADLEPGDNLCCIYETEAEHRAVVTPFLRLGLERGEKVLYIADAHAPETILAYLGDDGVDVKSCLSSGQLSIIGRESTYSGEQAFDADGMIALLRAETEAALRQAYAGVRVTGEMPWGRRELPGSEQMVEYEGRLADSLSGSHCLAIWQYDRRRFEAQVLLDVLRTHPIVMIGTRVYDNLYYASPTEPSASDPAQGTLDQWLRNLKTRQLIEETLHESERRFRSFVEQSEDGIMLADEQGAIAEWNRGAEQIFGLERGQALGQKLWDVLYQVLPEGQKMPAAYERLKDSLSGLFRTGQGSWLNALRETEVRRPDGTRCTVQSSMFAIQTGKGFTVGSISRDVTDRRRVEEALLKSEARYRALVEQIPAIIYISSLTESNTSFYVSPQVQRILGYSQAEWGSSSQLWLRQLHGEDRRRVLAALARSHESGEPFSQEYRLLSRDGQPLWFHDAAVVVRDEAGRGLFLQGIMLDITDRKQAEEELHQRATELVLLNEIGQQIIADLELDNVLQRGAHLVQESFGYHQVAVFVVDPEHGDLAMKAHAGSSADLDPADYRVKPGEGLVGSVAKLGERILAGDVGAEPRYRDLYPAAVTTRSELSVPIRTGQGLVGVLDVQSPQLNAFDEKDVLAIETVADQIAVAIKNARLYGAAQRELGERMRAEAALREEQASLARRVEERTSELSIANAELARAARLKDEFLANMSHELRTPLNAVLGLSEALQEEVYGPLTDRQRKSLRGIEDSGRHLLTLVNDILDLAKVEAGKLELQLGPVLVAGVCQASLTMVKQMAHNKQIKVSISVDPEVDTLQADERQLKQILVNLLSNAVKFTPEGGTVGLEVVGDREQEVVRLTIWDTGIGIAQEDLKRLFQPFIQLDGGLARQYPGTGLGLSLVRRLAELHGGGVSVESESGRGSRFTVSLPWVEEATSVQDLATPLEIEARGLTPVPHGSRPLILLAEDNETSISLFRDYLVNRGYRVTVARNGLEAIERAEEERPAVVLMDMQMPGMDGLAATRLLRAHASLATVPVIALTALAMPGDRERCLEAGANDYLSKPISMKQLVQAIETQLASLPDL